jgi:hypothetical protein
MGLQSISTTTVSETPLDAVVRYISGSHGSLFDPSASVAATTEMQTQVATFFATNGTVVAVNNEAVVAN